MSAQGKLIIQAVRAAAARNLLHVFQGQCLYVKNGCPACLIGHAMWDLGLIDGTLEESAHNEDGVDFLLGDLGVELDERELHWLESAQAAQDSHYTWADSIRAADEKVAEYDADRYL